MFAREIVHDKLLDAVAQALEDVKGDAGRLGFDDAGLTVAQHTHLRERLPDAWELVPCGGMVERLRAVKDPGEIARIRAASELADEALSHILKRGLAGRTERDVAIDLELQIRRLGAEPSFPSIVASGAHGALPHAEPRDEPIARDVLVTIDWGALHEGYCSDCTRTYATGEGVCAQAREVYELVRRAQAEGLAAVRAGIERRGARRRGARESSRPPATASTSATASVTASAWRSTRARACRAPPARIRCWRETSSRSSPASTCPASAVCVSRICWSSARTLTRC